MTRRRPHAGDHENTDIETVDVASHHVKPGFDSGDEESEPQEGDHRFPHRRSEKDVPKTSLAERLRGEPERTD